MVRPGKSRPGGTDDPSVGPTPPPPNHPAGPRVVVPLLLGLCMACSGQADPTAPDGTASVASVEVSPASDTMDVGSTAQYAATVRDADGNELTGETVSWSTGDTFVATVDGTGLTTGEGAGGTSITATVDGVSGSSGVTVEDTGSSTSTSTEHSHEPSGFTRLAEHSFEDIPLPGPPRVCDALGVLAGCWFRYDPNLNFSPATVLDAPTGDVGVLRIRFPAGLSPGGGPGLFQAGDGDTEGSSGEYEAIYESSWVRIPTSDFEMQRVGVKFLGYVGVARKGQGGAPNQVYFVSWCGNCEDATVKPDAGIDVVQQGNQDRRLSQNQATGRIFSFGEWHHFEYVMTLNDIGAANGTLKVWLDGSLTHHYTDVMWRDADNPSGFHARHWDPVWGGNGGSAKSRDDFLEIDHVYISGIPMN